jgi:hypothetical protein
VSSASRPILAGRKISRAADAKTAGTADDAGAAGSYRRSRPHSERSGSMKQWKVAAAGMLALALCGGAGASAHTAVPQTLVFTSVGTSEITTPQPSKSAPPKIGDRIVFKDVMYNRAVQFGKPSGALVGRAEGVCTLMSSTKPEAQCLITAHVPNGEIVVVGEGDPGAKLVHYAITGGIGAYANARGMVVARTISDTKTLIQVQLAG